MNLYCRGVGEVGIKVILHFFNAMNTVFNVREHQKGLLKGFTVRKVLKVTTYRRVDIALINAEQ